MYYLRAVYLHNVVAMEHLPESENQRPGLWEHTSEPGDQVHEHGNQVPEANEQELQAENQLPDPYRESQAPEPEHQIEEG